MWGVASSAYQIEGAADVDGRGKSIWDLYCEQWGVIADGHGGHLGCDHYYRRTEDVDLISDLGVGAYRFSVSWPRVLPHGVGEVNEKGLAFYDQLIDELLQRGISPWLTLFHWDLPASLYYRGGWLNRDIIHWFAEYTELLVDRFSDRVQNWITLNEPQCFIGIAHGLGIHAPAVKYHDREIVRAIHHSLLAHGKAVEVIRSLSKKPSQVGWSPAGFIYYPQSEITENLEAAKRKMFSIPGGNHWVLNNVWYSDPAILGAYPEEGLKRFERYLPRSYPKDLELISQPLDFYGVNIYHGDPVVEKSGSPKKTHRGPGYPRTMMNWPIDPKAIYWGPKFLQERYQLPIYVTENGVATQDWVHADGTVPDLGRIDYLTRYLSELQRCVSEGVDVRGYFHWTLLDNFEWDQGYSKRFGLVYVDFETQERIPKSSYAWFKKLIESRAKNLPTEFSPLK